MEKKVIQTYLYDFYGELLTEHQRLVYEDFVQHDLTLSEIAQERGISRQGVHDIVKRCDKLLNNYEDKLHLLSRFLNIKEKVTEILELTADKNDDNEISKMEVINRILNDILEAL